LTSGKYNQYLRSGGQANSKLELIYKDLINNLGSGYAENTAVAVEMFAYAQAINYFQNQSTEHLNNTYFPLNFTYNLQNEISFYNLTFLKSECEQRLFLSLIYSTVATAINIQSLTVIFQTLCPNTFSGIFVNNTTNEVWSPNYQIYNNGVQEPIDSFLQSNGGSFIPGGSSWTYNNTQNYGSSINQYRIGIKNTGTGNFKYDIQKMSTFLNIVLPAFIGYNFCVLQNGNTTGIILGGQEIVITGTSTINQTLHFNWVDTTLGAQSIGIGLSSGNTAAAVASGIQSSFAGTAGGFPGYHNTFTGGSTATVYFSDYRCLYMTAVWTLNDPGQTVTALNSGGLGPQITGSSTSLNPGSPVNILNGYYAF
jgi:hypothetical protein